MKHKSNDVSSPLSLENKTTVCADQSMLVSGESGAGANIETHLFETQHSRSKTTMSNDIEDSSSNHNVINLLENTSPKKGCRFNSTNNSNADEDTIPSKSFSSEEDDERVDNDDERRATLTTAANNGVNNINLKALCPIPAKRSTLLPRTSLNLDRDNENDGTKDRKLKKLCTRKPTSTCNDGTKDRKLKELDTRNPTSARFATMARKIESSKSLTLGSQYR